MKVYVPMWLEIKANFYAASGARHIFKAISFVKQQYEEVQKIVVSVLQKRHKNILIAMLADENSNIKELAWSRINKSRSNESSRNVREFKITELNFECKEYHNIKSCVSINVTEPPATMAISDPELDNYIAAEHLFKVAKYPLHTQAVEKAI